MSFALTPVVTKLQELSQLKLVGEAAELALARENIKQLPAAFILPMRNAGGRNELSIEGTAMQRVAITFAVVIAIQNLRDTTGGKANEDLAAVRGLVMGKLLAWRPTDAHDPCLFANGAMIGMRDRVLWWQDSYTTGIYARKT
jgi:hypothetical protein